MTKDQQYFLELGQGFSVAVGLPRISSWDTPNRPQKPKRGTLGFNGQTNALEYWDGENWFAVSMTKL